MPKKDKEKGFRWMQALDALVEKDGRLSTTELARSLGLLRKGRRGEVLLRSRFDEVLAGLRTRDLIIEQADSVILRSDELTPWRVLFAYMALHQEETFLRSSYAQRTLGTDLSEMYPMQTLPTIGADRRAGGVAILPKKRLRSIRRRAKDLSPSELVITDRDLVAALRPLASFVETGNQGHLPIEKGMATASIDLSVTERGRVASLCKVSLHFHIEDRAITRRSIEQK